MIGDLRLQHKYDIAYYTWKDVDVELTKGTEITNSTSYVKFYVTSWDINAAANIRFIIIELTILIISVIVFFMISAITKDAALAFTSAIQVFIGLSTLHLLILGVEFGWQGFFKFIKYIL